MVAPSVSVPYVLAVNRSREKFGIRGALGLALVALVAPPSRAWQSIEESVEITPSDAQGAELFGLALAASGSTVVVGALRGSHPQVPQSGVAYVLERHQGGPGAWGEAVKLLASDAGVDDFFGTAVAISGDTIVVGADGDNHPGANNAGSAYVFARNQGGPGNWGEVVKLVASDAFGGDRFGGAVAVSEDVIFVGADGADIAGATHVGAVYVFERDQGGPNAWGEVAKLTSSDWQTEDHFGNAVAIFGNTAVIGAIQKDYPGESDAGAAYVFELDQGGSGTWGETAKLVASIPQFTALFGSSVAIEEDTLVIGALQDKVGNVNSAGSAYVFERDAGTWTESARLISSNPAVFAAFGASVALSGDRLLVGESGAFHVYDRAGAAHVFERDQGGSGTWSVVDELHSTTPIEVDLFGASVAISATTILVGASHAEPGYDLGDIKGLEFDPSTGGLFGSEPVGLPGEQRLIVLDPLTGSGVPLGFTGNHDIRGLALDPSTNTLYAADCKGNQLMTVNLTTGQALPVGPLGFTDVNGLAFDPVTGTLYGTDGSTDNLITIDTASGAGTIVGPLGLSGFFNVTGLAFDPDAGILYGSNVSSNQLVTIDTATGNATVVGPFGFLQVAGLAFDPASDTLYGADIDSGTLITIDPDTGLGTAVGPYSTSIFDTGAVVVFEDFLPTETYCTAGTSASGCQALIGASGKASATAVSGFSLLIAGVEGQKDGLYFFGTNGRQANSWGSGTSYVCVVPPRKRAGLLVGAGTLGACDGSMAQDLNALWCPTCPKPLHNPGAGALVQAQLWYRDPLSTSNQTSSMSDAIEFLVDP